MGYAISKECLDVERFLEEARQMERWYDIGLSTYKIISVLNGKEMKTTPKKGMK